MYMGYVEDRKKLLHYQGFQRVLRLKVYGLDFRV